MKIPKGNFLRFNWQYIRTDPLTNNESNLKWTTYANKGIYSKTYKPTEYQYACWFDKQPINMVNILVAKEKHEKSISVHYETIILLQFSLSL